MFTRIFHAKYFGCIMIFIRGGNVQTRNKVKQKVSTLVAKSRQKIGFIIPTECVTVNIEWK